MSRAASHCSLRPSAYSYERRVSPSLSKAGTTRESRVMTETTSSASATANLDLDRRRSPVKTAGLAVIAAVGYALLAYLCVEFPRNLGQVAPIWLSNGFGVACLLSCRQAAIGPPCCWDAWSAGWPPEPMSATSRSSTSRWSAATSSRSSSAPGACVAWPAKRSIWAGPRHDRLRPDLRPGRADRHRRARRHDPHRHARRRAAGPISASGRWATSWA
jgi:hypothetical protein